MRGILKLMFNLFGYPVMVSRYGLQKCLRLGIFIIGIVSVVGLGMFVPWNIQENIVAQRHQHQHQQQQAAIEHVNFAGPSQEPSIGSGDGTTKPIGMTVIILCLSIISIGDVLGYVSVLVLFGRAADRLKGAMKSDGTNNTARNSNFNSNSNSKDGNDNKHDDDTGGRGAAHGGSGVLWSLARVSANIMRLAGPVVAG
ncbi:hypothetical protein BGX26_003013, partial [Mortierella sp. AD094]